MFKNAHVNITLDESLLHWIDMDRGQIPRSTFINRVLAKISKKHLDLFDWKEEDLKAREDIKKARVRKFKNKDEAIKWLKS